MPKTTAAPEIIIPERYQVDHVVADNAGMSAMLAYDVETGERVFAKARIPDHDDLATNRIANEANMLASLDHPQIPGFRDADPAADHPWIVTDFVETVPVRKYFKETDDPSLAAELVMSALGALEHVHDRKIVHRDIKPANLLMSWEQTVVADFDIARHIGQAAANDVSLEGPDGMAATWNYASPEQLYSLGDLDGRSDLYSMGQVLLHFLSGKPPISGDSVNQMIARRIAVGDNSHDLLARHIPEGLMAVVNQAVRELPGERFQSAGEMAEELERWLHDNPRDYEAAEAVPIAA